MRCLLRLRKQKKRCSVRPVRLGGDFFGSKCSDGNPFFDHRFGYREIGVRRSGVAPNSGL